MAGAGKGGKYAKAKGAVHGGKKKPKNTNPKGHNSKLDTRGYGK